MKRMLVDPQGRNHVHSASPVRRAIEGTLVAAGTILVLAFAAVQAHRAILVRAEMNRFKAEMKAESDRIALSSARPGAPAPSLPGDADIANHPAVPLPRSAAHANGRIPYSGHAIAVLRIAKLSLEVPVLDGTDAITLNRGVGRIQGTALPGQKGNIAIAGHRDGFFRGLKDIHTGDRIELRTAQGTDIYIVDRTVVVDPDDVSVLEDGATPALTLVTCYPFHYIGPAPRRFVVKASLKH
jgi:sortase A